MSTWDVILSTPAPAANPKLVRRKVASADKARVRLSENLKLASYAWTLEKEVRQLRKELAAAHEQTRKLASGMLESAQHASAALAVEDPVYCPSKSPYY
ncbi:hypothetical protein BT96DRAFT_1000387 [Gymnopus androsaceus JB14]|uniref:Uncharacterized protein n=1 Tax=Gymnopus androsaceus JB14 TaxID=1447944 RepID=A0A6A4H5B4_9AGAR|nr:hypothetical protein BT96DRAFT_1000387 [Gymnopus androsaceus JB14]